MDFTGNKNIIAGPFISINYVYANTLSGMNFNEYTFGGGLRFSYKLKHIKTFPKYDAQIFSSEIGYRNITGIHKFYFSVTIDIILGLIGIGEAIR